MPSTAQNSKPLAACEVFASIHGGASVRESKIPYLRTSPLPVAWSPRGANRDQPGGSRLQSEKNAEYPRRTPTGFSATNRLKQPRQQHSPAKNKKATLQNPKHRFSLILNLTVRFVTDCFGRALSVSSVLLFARNWDDVRGASEEGFHRAQIARWWVSGSGKARCDVNLPLREGAG